MFAVGVGGERDAVGAAEVAEDDAGFGFEEEEARAIIEAHEGAGGGETAFREEGEAAAFLEEFGHVLDGVGGVGVDWEAARVEHDLPVEP